MKKELNVSQMIAKLQILLASKEKEQEKPEKKCS
jgi:hypothetical protein